MKTALVTGAAGFIGANLCLHLLKKSQVIGIDNLISGSRRNIIELQKNSRFLFIKGDITKEFDIKNNIQEIWDLACPASLVDCQKYPIEILMTCSVGVKNLLDLALQKKAVFLHTSTSEVYGDPLIHPQKETYWGHVNPIGNRSCYDEGKRFAESLIENYRKKYALETKIVRIFNTYGPRMRKDDGRVVSNFINQAIRGQPLTIYGRGDQTRSFCYIDDLIRGLIRMMASSESGPINLGNPSEFKVIDLARTVINLTGSRSRTSFLPLPKDDPKQRRPDIELAKKRLGWYPKVNLKEGLLKTVKYFRGL